MRTKRHLYQLAAFLLVFPVIALACAVPSVSLQFGDNQNAQPAVVASEPTALPPAEVIAEQPATITGSAAVDEEEAFINIYAKVNPAVVNVTIYTSQNGLDTPLGQGSGWLFDNNRHFVTNAHVVQDADEIDVTFADGTIATATLVGKDLNSDLAVIQTEWVPDNVQPLALGDMSELIVGQSVAAIGNPFGLNGTLTRGIISALGRQIPALNQFSIPQSIQTDAAINPGNSGGPLLNLQGEVIGVNAQIETNGTVAANAGVGFAIPVSIIQRVVPDLIAKGHTEWSYLGVVGGSLFPTLVDAMDLPVNQGAYLSQIVDGGPAAQAGLQGSNNVTTLDGREVEVGGDVIVAIDGQEIHNFDDLLVYIALNTRPGQNVTLTIVRNGQTQTVQLDLGTRPADPQT